VTYSSAILGTPTVLTRTALDPVQLTFWARHCRLAALCSVCAASSPIGTALVHLVAARAYTCAVHTLTAFESRAAHVLNTRLS
jgi:hypothetical protein